MQKFGVQYKINEWRHFIDSSKRSLKAVLLHNGNYASLPIGHSVYLSIRFHQDIKEMERTYQGRWNVNMMGDYCWALHCDIPETSHNRKSNTRSFVGEKVQGH
jgi:hypothetical protein